MEFFRKLKESFSFFLPLELIIGVLLLIYPGFTGKAVCYILGGMLIIGGISRIVSSRKTGLSGSGGVLMILTGIFVVLFNRRIISFIPIIFGMILLTGGISSLQGALYFKNMGNGSWKGTMVSAVLKLVLGVIILLNPFKTGMTLMRFIGLRLLFDRGMSLVEVYKTAKVRARAQKADRELRSYNLGKDDDSGEIPVVDAEVVDSDK